MSNTSTTRLYGGIERPSIHFQITNCTLPTAFIATLGLLRFTQEGFAFDPYAMAFFAAAGILHWKFRS